MGQFAGFTDFKPDTDIPSLKGKVIFITGGTAGLGQASIDALLTHEPEHVYFSGRNAEAGRAFIDKTKPAFPSARLTFVQLDLASLASVKTAAAQSFAHDRLDILMCNAGIMAEPPSLSKDGFEIHFATNHLGHAMLVQQLLSIMLRTAELPGADVRIVMLTSVGWRGHPSRGILFDKLQTTQDGVLGPWIRYGQSKLANIIYAAELARRYPKILSVSVHPGVVETGLVTELSFMKKATVYVSNFVTGTKLMRAEEGCYSQLWCAAGGRRGDMVNGAWYMPIGVLSNDKLDRVAKSTELAEKLWKWTEDVLAKF